MPLNRRQINVEPSATACPGIDHINMRSGRQQFLFAAAPVKT
jgi:hypothetical protein